MKPTKLVRIDAELHRRLKVIAARTGTTIAQVIEAIYWMWLSHKPKQHTQHKKEKTK